MTDVSSHCSNCGYPSAMRAKFEAEPRPRNEVAYQVIAKHMSPLLMDRFPESEMVREFIYPMPGYRRPVQSVLERCQEKFYRDAEGFPILKARHLLACLQTAGRSIKIGTEGKISTASETKLFAFLELEQEEIRLVFPEVRDPLSLLPNEASDGVDTIDVRSPWKVDVRRGVGEARDFANSLIRPRFDAWGFELKVKVDLGAIDGLTIDHIKLLFERAGSRVGLLSYRPATHGPFGRFRIESIKETHA